MSSSRYTGEIRWWRKEEGQGEKLGWWSTNMGLKGKEELAEPTKKTVSESGEKGEKNTREESARRWCMLATETEPLDFSIRRFLVLLGQHTGLPRLGQVTVIIWFLATSNHDGVPGFESQLCHLLAVWFGQLNLSFCAWVGANTFPRFLWLLWGLNKHNSV